MDEPTADDRYRVRYSPGGSVLSSLLRRVFMFGPTGKRASLPSNLSERAAEPEVLRGSEDAAPGRRGRGVAIERIDGTVVWFKPVTSQSQAEELIDLIHRQVLTARLVDFEAWLASGPGDRP